MVAPTACHPMQRSAVAAAARTPARSGHGCRLLRSPRPSSVSLQQLCTQPRWRTCRSSLVAAAASELPAAAEAGAEQQQPEEQQLSALQLFLRWLIANGVEGIGTAGSKVGLYEGENGERGVMALAPIAAGEAVMCIPLRLAVTDYQEIDDEEEGATGEQRAPLPAASPQEQQPWSVRLAMKLLELKAQGAACPWAPYLATLPAAVPSPLTAFSWEDIQAVEYPPMLRQRSSGPQPGSASISFSQEQVDWALSVVHSRSFGAPGKHGAVAVRMLVPLVDMLNHAGDVTVSEPRTEQPQVQAFDNVRWDLKAPQPVAAATGSAGSQGGQQEPEWCMVVSATRGIAQGEELLLSYGERSNDDFFAHYGFVPPHNPHDTVALFSDIESAMDWWLEEFLPKGVMAPQQLQAAIAAAYRAAEDQDGAAAAAEATLAAMPEAEAEAARAELAHLKLSAGGLVDGRLLAAFRSLQAGCAAVVEELQVDWQQHLRAAVSRRASQILAGMGTPLVDDLTALAAWEAATGDTQHGWAAVAESYQGVAGEALAGSSGGSSGSGSTGGGSTRNMLPVTYRAYKKLILTDAALL